MLSDAELIDRVLQGDTEVFATLVHRYERIVRGVALNAISDRHAAEDVVQESFLAAFKSFAQHRPSRYE